MPGKWSQFSDDEKDQLLESLEGFYNSPKVGHKVKELIEEHYGVTDPELSNSRRHSQQVTELQGRIDTLESQNSAREIRARIDKEKEAAQLKHKLSDDDMKEVSKLMLESGIGSYEAAADYYRLSKQAAKPVSDKVVEHSAISLPGDPELFKDKTAWARKMAYQTVAELERNRQ